MFANQLAAQPDIAGHVFNFSYERPQSVLDVVEKLLRVMQSDLHPEIRNEATHEIRDQYLDASKARRVLGWTPGFEFEGGLRATVAWYRDHFARG